MSAVTPGPLPGMRQPGLADGTWMGRQVRPSPSLPRADRVAPLRAYEWPTNADLIADVFRLAWQAGWWTPDARVCDVTSGEKDGWWKQYEPPGLVRHDPKIDGVTFLDLPEPDGTYDVVAYDAPYIGVGGVETSTAREFQSRFGIDHQKSKRPDDVTAMLIAGLVSVGRVLAPGGHVLFKAMNYVEGARYRTVAYDALHAARGLGYDLVDEFMFLRKAPGPQPGCRTCRGTGDRDGAVCGRCGGDGKVVAQHSRANYSILFVLRHPTGLGGRLV